MMRRRWDSAVSFNAEAMQPAATSGLEGPTIRDSTSPHIADCVLHRICRFAATHKVFDSIRRRSTGWRYPVNFFFKLDPLAALVNLLADHALYRGLAWSLIILIPTLFLGRFFCGWICPLGSLNQFLGNIRSKSKGRKIR
jgi:polyferredoxin